MLQIKTIKKLGDSETFDGFIARVNDVLTAMQKDGAEIDKCDIERRVWVPTRSIIHYRNGAK